MKLSRRNLSKLWKVVSLAVIIGVLSLYSLFFILFLNSYHVTLSETNPFLAASELALLLSSLIYIIKTNISFRKFSFILRYPLVTLAITQPLDVITTWISLTFLGGHESNPVIAAAGIFNIFPLTMKLLVFPLVLLYIHYKHYLFHKSLITLIKILCLVMFVIILNNIVGFI